MFFGGWGLGRIEDVFWGVGVGRMEDVFHTLIKC